MAHKDVVGCRELLDLMKGRPKPNQQPKKRQRKRNITYYNLPFNAVSDVNLGKNFFNSWTNMLPRTIKGKMS